MSAPEKDNARRQPGEVGKAKTTQLAFSFGDVPLVKPRDPDGQAGARVCELIERGYNVIRIPVGTKFIHGRFRRRLAAYSLASPEWIPPCGGR